MKIMEMASDNEAGLMVVKICENEMNIDNGQWIMDDENGGGGQ